MGLLRLRLHPQTGAEIAANWKAVRMRVNGKTLEDDPGLFPSAKVS
jgi:hypothetical protein